MQEYYIAHHSIICSRIASDTAIFHSIILHFIHNLKIHRFSFKFSFTAKRIRKGLPCLFP